MSEARTEWWHRASAALDDGRFNYEFRQVHGLANLSEYAPDPVQARRAIPFRHRPDKLYETAIQILTAASLEISSGASLQDEHIRRAHRTVGRLLYFLYLGEYDHFAQEDLLLRAALAFDLAGHTANSVVALRLRDVQQGVPTATDLPAVDLAVYLFLSRRISELRRLANRWERSLIMKEQSHPRLAAHLDALSALGDFLVSGDSNKYEEATMLAQRAARLELEVGTTRDWYLSHGFELAVQRLRDTSVWLALRKTLGDLTPLWRAYVRGLALGKRDRVFSPVLGENVRGGSIIDLWPSQLEALSRGFLKSEATDRVVRMPTSAGKTQLAEFDILATLSKRPEAVCVYIVPFVALANEARETLRNSLGRIGLRVADLFQGEYELTDIDQALLARNDVVICTPEKLDLMIRRSADFLTRVGLFIFDEGHMIDESARGVRYEFLIDRLRRYRQRTGLNFRLLVMSAVVPNAADLAEWVSGSEDGLLDLEWKPTEVRFGVFHWRRGGERGDINYPEETHGDEEYYVPGVVERYIVRTRYYPRTKSEICAELARALVGAGPVVIFAATKPNVGGVVKAIHKMLDRAKATLPVPPDGEHQRRLHRALVICEDYLGDDHDLVKALEKGFAYHTGDVPQSVRAQIERLYEAGTINVLVCTNTLAQGVNLPVKSLIVHSLFRGGPTVRISSRDFMNMAGRTARALRQLEGQVIFVHKDKKNGFLQYEKEVQNLHTVEGYVISSIMLLYAHLARERGELAADPKTREILATLASTRNLEEDLTGRLSEGLAALDGQLLGLLVEEEVQAGAIDAAEILVGSLFDIQSKKYGVNPAPIYSDLTDKMTEIAADLKDDIIRQCFFRTGLRRESCRTLLKSSHLFLDKLEDAPDTLKEAQDVVRAAFEVSIQADETKPRKEAAAIKDLFTPFWTWLTGIPVREMPREEDVSGGLLSKTIEDLYVRKVPWGINSLYILAEQDIEARRDPLPGYLRYLPGLARYGVPTPEAAICRAVGVSDRTSAIRLAEACPHRNNPLDVDVVLDWLARLSLDDFNAILGERETALRVYEEIQEAQLGNPGAGKFREGEWDNVEVRGVRYHTDIETIRSIKVGDELLLIREPENPRDANAIEVLVAETQAMIGYLDRDYARILAPLLDEGIRLKATVSKRTPRTEVYPLGRLYVRITEER